MSTRKRAVVSAHPSGVGVLEQRTNTQPEQAWRAADHLPCAKAHEAWGVGGGRRPCAAV